MIRLLLCYFSVILLAACTPKSAPNATASTAGPKQKGETQAEDTADMPGDAIEQVFVGLYRQQGPQLEFIPCDAPEKSYWVIGNTEKLTDLYEAAIRQGYEGQNVVASVRGLLKKPKIGSNSPYDAQLEVEEVVKVRPKNFRNTCVPFDFWGLGNEPFWSLQISEAEGVIEFSKLGEETIMAEYVKPTIEKEGLRTRYYVNFPNGQRMKIAINQEDCKDSMAGNPYEYSIEVSYNGEVLQGCATKGE